MFESLLINLLAALGGAAIFLFWGFTGLMLALLPRRVRERFIERYIN